MNTILFTKRYSLKSEGILERPATLRFIEVEKRVLMAFKKESKNLDEKKFQGPRVCYVRDEMGSYLFKF